MSIELRFNPAERPNVPKALAHGSVRFCSELHLRLFTSQITRYFRVVVSLPLKLVAEMGGISAVPPMNRPHDHFEAGILRRTAESESS